MPRIARASVQRCTVIRVPSSAYYQRFGLSLLRKMHQDDVGVIAQAFAGTTTGAPPGARKCTRFCHCICLRFDQLQIGLEVVRLARCRTTSALEPTQTEDPLRQPECRAG